MAKYFSSMSKNLIGAVNEVGLKNWLGKKYPHLQFQTTQNYSLDDMKGIDVLGKDFKGKVVFLAQSKSSIMRAMEFNRPPLYIDSELLPIHVFYVDNEGDWQELQ